jgi:hypothetical protein
VGEAGEAPLRGQHETIIRSDAPSDASYNSQLACTFFTLVMISLHMLAMLTILSVVSIRSLHGIRRGPRQQEAGIVLRSPVALSNKSSEGHFLGHDIATGLLLYLPNLSDAP